MKPIASITLVLCLSLMTAGCWDYRELDEIAVVMAMGIDKAENGMYKLSFQIANPGEVRQNEDQASGQSPITTYTATGFNEIEAIWKATEKVPRRMFFAHKRLIVISEAVAREGIGTWFDLIQRGPQGNTVLPVLVARHGNTAEAVLSILSPLEKIPSKYFVEQLQTHESTYGEVYPVEVADVLRVLNYEGRQPVLPGARIIGDPAVAKNMENLEHTMPLAKLKLDGMALFDRDGKLIRWLEGPVSRGLSFANNKIDNTIVSLDCQERKKGLAVEIHEARTTIRPEWSRGKLTFYLHTTGEGEVLEVHCPMKLGAPETIRRLEEELSREVAGEIRQAVRAAQRARSDVLGLGETLHRKRPDLWRKWEQEWDRRFAQAEIRVSSTFRIRRTGLQINPYQA